jgi:hypothetical protein
MVLDRELIADIETAVLEQGSLSKEDILLRWELTEDQYPELRRVLTAREEVEPGPQRTGGFRAREQRGRLPEERPDSLLREGWENAVVQRLTEWFQHKELEELLY